MERHLYAFDTVNHGLDDIVELLTNRPNDVLDFSDERIARATGPFMAHLHIDVGSYEIGHEVVITLGESFLMGKTTVAFPLHWQATGGSPGFPEVTGVIEVTALSESPPVSQVTFLGHYHPPMGPLGAIADAGPGKRVATASVRNLLDDIVARLNRHLAKVAN